MKLILACDPHGGIGYRNSLPWNRIKGDLTRFKNLTTDGVVVMGRNTWESLPISPLPNRLNIVVTSRDIPETAIAVPDLTHFVNFKNAWLIGGAVLVNSSWHLIDEVHLTKVHAEYTCDSFIDIVKLNNEFTCISVLQETDHDYQIWKRK